MHQQDIQSLQTNNQVSFLVLLSYQEARIVKKNKLHDFRKTYSPNSFGVIGEINDNSLYEILSIGMIGIDYFDAREFPKDSS